jgi:membrane fusion protein (multidrug efflux system)
MGLEAEAQESKAGRAGSRAARWIPAMLVIIAAALVGFVALMPNETPPMPEPVIPPVNVKVRTVQAIPQLADTFELTAVVEPNRVVRVAAEVAGRIESFGSRGERVAASNPVHRPNSNADPLPTSDERGQESAALTVGLEEGDFVFRGDPIVHLNADLYRAGFDRAQAQFELDQREYRRVQGLFERDAAPKKELDDARTKREISKAALDEATAQLERTTISAPISGVLNRLPMEVGEYAASGDCVAEIVDVEQVKVVVDVPERDVHYLKVGDIADVSLRAPDDRVVKGEIAYMSEVADEHTRTTRLEITVDNRDNLLRSGQIVRARLTRRILTNVILIELAAVIPLEDGKAVYVVDGSGRAERRVVQLGVIKGRSVQVLGGLQVGDRLIVAGHRYVGPGQPVAVVEEQ